MSIIILHFILYLLACNHSDWHECLTLLRLKSEREIKLLHNRVSDKMGGTMHIFLRITICIVNYFFKLSMSLLHIARIERSTCWY